MEAFQSALRDRDHAAAEPLLIELNLAGLEAAWAADDASIVIDGVPFDPWEARDAERFLLDVVARTSVVPFETVVRNELPDDISVRPGPRRLRLMDGSRHAASLSPLELDIEPHGRASRRRLSGPFFREGRHWGAARIALWEQLEIAEGRMPAPQRDRTDNPPAALPHPHAPAGELFTAEVAPVDRRDAMAEFSARLRVQRRRAFSWPVQLSTAEHRLILWPVQVRTTRSGGSTTNLRFEFHQSDRRLEGTLHLSAPRDPMAITTTASLTDAAYPWLLALKAAAELLCTPAHKTTSPSALSASAPTPQVRSTEKKRTEERRTGGVIEERFVVPQGWKPTRGTGELLRAGGGVVGHTRALGHKQPTDEAREEAARHGIVLPPGTTWVRPHHRNSSVGSGKLPMLSFRWTPPAA